MCTKTEIYALIGAKKHLYSDFVLLCEMFSTYIVFVYLEVDSFMSIFVIQIYVLTPAKR